jgi:hypothetical protein
MQPAFEFRRKVVKPQLIGQNAMEQQPNSTFIGQNAGSNATGASQSTLIWF